MVNIRHLKHVIREQMVKPSGLCNKLPYSSGENLPKPQILLRQSLATVRRPTLNEMSSGHKVIPSCVRIRSMYFFLGPYYNEKGTQMLPLLFSWKCSYIAQTVHRQLCLDHTL